jgi:hypothetical protein
MLAAACATFLDNKPSKPGQEYPQIIMDTAKDTLQLTLGAAGGCPGSVMACSARTVRLAKRIKLYGDPTDGFASSGTVSVASGANGHDNLFSRHPSARNSASDANLIKDIAACLALGIKPQKLIEYTGGGASHTDVASMIGVVGEALAQQPAEALALATVYRGAPRAIRRAALTDWLPKSSYAQLNAVDVILLTVLRPRHLVLLQLRRRFPVGSPAAGGLLAYLGDGAAGGAGSGGAATAPSLPDKTINAHGTALSLALLVPRFKVPLKEVLEAAAASADGGLDVVLQLIADKAQNVSASSLGAAVELVQRTRLWEERDPEEADFAKEGISTTLLAPALECLRRARETERACESLHRAYPTRVMLTAAVDAALHRRAASLGAARADDPGARREYFQRLPPDSVDRALLALAANILGGTGAAAEAERAALVLAAAYPDAVARREAIMAAVERRREALSQQARLSAGDLQGYFDTQDELEKAKLRIGARILGGLIMGAEAAAAALLVHSTFTDWRERAAATRGEVDLFKERYPAGCGEQERLRYYHSLSALRRALYLCGWRAVGGVVGGAATGATAIAAACTVHAAFPDAAERGEAMASAVAATPAAGPARDAYYGRLQGLEQALYLCGWRAVGGAEGGATIGATATAAACAVYAAYPNTAERGAAMAAAVAATPAAGPARDAYYGRLHGLEQALYLCGWRAVGGATIGATATAAACAVHAAYPNAAERGTAMAAAVAATPAAGPARDAYYALLHGLQQALYLIGWRAVGGTTMGALANAAACAVHAAYPNAAERGAAMAAAVENSPAKGPGRDAYYARLRGLEQALYLCGWFAAGGAEGGGTTGAAATAAACVVHAAYPNAAERGAAMAAAVEKTPAQGHERDAYYARLRGLEQALHLSGWRAVSGINNGIALNAAYCLVGAAFPDPAALAAAQEVVMVRYRARFAETAIVAEQVKNHRDFQNSLTSALDKALAATAFKEQGRAAAAMTQTGTHRKPKW